MERLTSYKNVCKREMICRHEDCDTCEEYCPYMNEDNCTCMQEVLEKLAAYEDIGLTPEQLKEVDRLYAEKCKELAESEKRSFSGIEMVKIWANLKKFKEYQKLEEQGKLLKMPCAVGDTVYVIPSEANYKLNIINGYSENNRIYEQIVNRIEISGTGYLLASCDGMASVIDTFYKKTWFLTREAAEAALKELEGGKGK